MNIISPVGIPLFFTISGFLFFQKQRDDKDLWKYVWRVLKLYLVRTVIYLPFVLREYYKKQMLNALGIVDYIQQCIFSGSYYHLWFLPSLIVGIILAYFTSKKLDNKKLLMVSIALFTIGTLVDTYSFISPLLTWKTYKTFFVTTRNGLFFGFPFIAIGKIIADNKYRIRQGTILVATVAMLLEGYFLSFVVGKQIVNMSISSLIFVPMILVYVMDLQPIKIDGRLIRKASTLIFCAHPFVISIIGHFINGLSGTFFVLLLTVLSSLIVSNLSDRFRVINILI